MAVGQNDDAVKTKRYGELSFYSREMRCIDTDSWRYGYPRQWDNTLLTSSMRTDHTEISRARFGETERGGQTRVGTQLGNTARREVGVKRQEGA